MSQATEIVPWVTRQEIERLATRTRENHGCFSIPVDPYALATQMGVAVFQAEFDDENTAGAIRSRDGHPEILVREGDPSVRQSFTVAHELGHYVLHWTSNRPGERNTYVDTDLELYRHGPTPDDAEPNPDASRSSHYREVQANMFAAALLMPQAEVQREWERDRSIKGLARAFDVSSTAMQYRIEQLGLW